LHKDTAGKKAGKKGRVPLHSALQSSHNTDDIVLAGLEGCPKAASLPYRSSMEGKKQQQILPLYTALNRSPNKVSLAVVTALLAAHPAAIEVRLESGKYCLYLALLRQVETDFGSMSAVGHPLV
jgi:hypothetical protein